MKFKGIIFDLDGVVCHTDQFHFLAWKVIADKLHIPFTQEINNRLRGVSRRESLDIILENAGLSLPSDEKVKLTEEKNQIYREKLCGMSPSDVTDEARNTFVLLKQSGLLLAIGSSSKNARYILEKTDCIKYFDVICDGNDITHSKPHPEVFTLAGERLGLAPVQCAVVEDAVSGVQASVAAGMTPIAIGDAALANACPHTITELQDLLIIIAPD